MNKLIIAIILPLIAVPCFADKTSNTNHLHNNTKANATGIGIGHSSSNSNAGAFSGSSSNAYNGGNRSYNRSSNRSGSYSGNEGNNNTDRSRSYALGLPKADIPVGNSGISTPIFGFSGMSQARIDLFVLDKFNEGDLKESVKKGYCARLSWKVRKAVSDCTKTEEKGTEKTVNVRVSQREEKDDHDTNGIGW